MNYFSLRLGHFVPVNPDRQIQQYPLLVNPA